MPSTKTSKPIRSCCSSVSDATGSSPHAGLQEAVSPPEVFQYNTHLTSFFLSSLETLGLDVVENCRYFRNIFSQSYKKNAVLQLAAFLLPETLLKCHRHCFEHRANIIFIRSHAICSSPPFNKEVRDVSTYDKTQLEIIRTSFHFSPDAASRSRSPFSCRRASTKDRRCFDDHTC